MISTILWWYLPVAVLAFFVNACGKRPPLRLTQHSDSADVDVQTLGEYQTTITRVRLTDDASGSVLWELRKAMGTPQIHGFTLRVGVNRATLEDVASGQYEKVAPTEEDTFELVKNREYVLQIWGDDPEAKPVRAVIHFK